ncbi:uncharacterized protein LOC128258620 [Drosophila gunungcola]|uniref:Uncharacterized protein n=1 Tax=Drosophila gunungcola TaxID=103775 RepID=A0A9P9YP51_9MUSC|nr:uncharacterized protein LOC128258620 [Drosophila gunungcola]KAI8040501.1 hypothetical protein M5D96_006444 [Drosophila gunungcola]
MCICPTLGLKIGLLILIPITAGFNAAQVAKDISIWNEVKGSNQVILIISLALSIVITVALIPLMYATIRKIVLIIYVVLYFFIFYILAKLIILLVNVSIDNPDKTAAHSWFIACWFISFLCMAFIILYYIRLHDLSIDEDFAN